jgi:hypothetical protein
MTTSSVKPVQKPPPPPSKFIDARGYVTREWLTFLSQLQVVSNASLASTDLGTRSMLDGIAVQLLSRLESLDQRISALEIQGKTPPVSDKKKKPGDLGSVTNNITIKSEKQDLIVGAIVNQFYDKLNKRISDLETQMST